MIFEGEDVRPKKKAERNGVKTLTIVAKTGGKGKKEKSIKSVCSHESNLILYEGFRELMEDAIRKGAERKAFCIRNAMMTIKKSTEPIESGLQALKLRGIGSFMANQIQILLQKHGRFSSHEENVTERGESILRCRENLLPHSKALRQDQESTAINQTCSTETTVAYKPGRGKSRFLNVILRCSPAIHNPLILYPACGTFCISILLDAPTNKISAFLNRVFISSAIAIAG